jgi:phosphoesterase RecJ-like protein
MWSQIIKVIESHQRFIISSHVNPDCDALGSELALAYHLLNMGKTVLILNTDPVIPDYQFLDPDGLIQQFSDDHRPFISEAEIIIVVDTSGGWRRLGQVGDILAECEATSICIDHHPTDRAFTDVTLVDTQVAAAGELIYDLIAHMDGQLNPFMAQALYAAIATDSGHFRFPKTSPRTHRITAELIERGANPSRIYDLLYQQQPLSKVQLKGYVLNNINLASAGRIAYIGLDAETLARYNTTPKDLHAFSNLAQEIKGVQVSIFAVEADEGQVKLSFRSDGSVPVNSVAAEFGGGGHLPAAGATVYGQLTPVLKQAVNKVSRLLTPDN